MPFTSLKRPDKCCFACPVNVETAQDKNWNQKGSLNIATFTLVVSSRHAADTTAEFRADNTAEFCRCCCDVQRQNPLLLAMTTSCGGLKLFPLLSRQARRRSRPWWRVLMILERPRTSTA